MENYKAKQEVHRQKRMQKTLESGLEFLSETEQMKKLLSSVLSEVEIEPVAKALLKNFGSLYAIFSALPEELEQVDGINSRAAEFLHLLPDYLGIVQRSIMFFEKQAPYLLSVEDMGNFVQTLFNYKRVEAFYLISLNAAGKFLRFDKISEGTLDETAVYVRRIARHAILSGAEAVVLAHNHPGGRLVPSVPDVQSTREIIKSLRVLGIHVLDHIVVSGCDWVSMKELGLLSASVL